MRVNEGKTYGGAAGLGAAAGRGGPPTSGSSNINNGPQGRQSSLPLRPLFRQGRPDAAFQAGAARSMSPGSPPPPQHYRQQQQQQQQPVHSTDALRYSQSGSANVNPALRTSFSATSPPPLSASSTVNNRDSFLQQQPQTSGTSSSNINNNNITSNNAGTGKVQGILKSTKPTETSSTDKRNDGNNKPGAGSMALQNLLFGQKVTDAVGLAKPIKSLVKTLADLRAGKPPAEAFESKETSYHFKRPRGNPIADNSDDEDLQDAQPLHKISFLSVYFPMRKGKDSKHDPAECGKLCTGEPHYERGPVCRMCLARIAPKYKDNVSYVSFLRRTSGVLSPTTTNIDDKRMQHVFKARDCLDHLKSCPALTNEEDRELLYNGFREGDKDLIEDYKTSEWRSGLSLASEPHAVRPHMVPRRQAPASTSTFTNPLGAQNSNRPKPKAYDNKQPISAKNIPNRSSNVGASTGAGVGGSSTMRRQFSGDNTANRPNHWQNRSGSGSGSGPAPTVPPPRKVATSTNLTELANDRGWGVSSKNASYQQHVTDASVPEEQDELEDPQHDPEDNFIWQAVKSPNASHSSSGHEESGNVPPPPKEDMEVPPPPPPEPVQHSQTSQSARLPHYGAEVIVPVRPQHISTRSSPVPSRSSSRTSHRSSNSASNTPFALTSLDLLHSVQQSLASATSRPRSPLVPPTQQSLSQPKVSTAAAEAALIPESSGQPIVRNGPELFQPISPPSSIGRLLARADESVPSFDRSPSPDRLQDDDIPEPELPPEDEWDLIPGPGFEPLDLHSRAFIRSSAPSLESKPTPRDLSVSPEPAEEETTPRPTWAIKSLPEEQRPCRVTRSPSVELLNPIQPPPLSQRSSAHQATTPASFSVSNNATAKVAAQAAIPRSAPAAAPLFRAASQTHVDDASSNSSDDIPLRKVPSSESGVTRVAEDPITSTSSFVADSQPNNIVDLVSDSDSSEDIASPPPKLVSKSAKHTVASKSKRAQTSKNVYRNKGSKSNYKGKARQPRSPSVAEEAVDSSSDSDYESDAPQTTSIRVVQPEASESERSPSSANVSRTTKLAQGSSSKSARKTGRPIKKHVRTPSLSLPPVEPSDEESGYSSPPRTSQAAAFVRRFQRFADRDRSPEDEVGSSTDEDDGSEESDRPLKASIAKRKSSGKSSAEKYKTRRKSDKKRKRKSGNTDSSPPLITRRRLDDDETDALLSSLNKSSAKRAKAIRVSDEEENTPVHRKRLRTYREKSAELADRGFQRKKAKSSSSLPEAPTSPPVHLRTASEEPARLLMTAPDVFFVDLDKNYANTAPLPVELDPWAEVFDAVDIRNLDMLQNTVRHPENADAFVEWLAKVSLLVLLPTAESGLTYMPHFSAQEVKISNP